MACLAHPIENGDCLFRLRLASHRRRTHSLLTRAVPQGRPPSGAMSGDPVLVIYLQALWIRVGVEERSVANQMTNRSKGLTHGRGVR